MSKQSRMNMLVFSSADHSLDRDSSFLLWAGSILLTIMCLCMINPAQAAQYISSPPLDKEITLPVGNVAKTAYTRVPFITWGGDEATILANGNQAKTASGSIFDKLGLKLELVREDDFKKQVESYMKGSTPYLRGTLGMINMASELLAKDPRTKPVIIYQLTWSSGGDCLVVKNGIKTATALKGKTVAIQAYGPHVYYLSKILADGGLSLKDINIKWVRDLTGTENTPMEAFHDSKVDAAMVIIPDGLVLTSNGTVGNGSEGSVKGAQILLSTKTANRIISDVYAVRSDFLKTHRSEVESFVHGLLLGEENLRELYQNKNTRLAEYSKMIKASATLLLDSPAATADAEALYTDCEYTGYKGNIKFFTDTNYPRNMDKLSSQIQDAFINIGLLRTRTPLTHASLDFAALKSGLKKTAIAEAAKFDTAQVAAVIQRKQQQDTLAEGELFSFEVYFQPNQNQFSPDMYIDAFNKVIELATTYGGAIITVEGHSDPLGYLKSKKQGSSELVLRHMGQSAKNLSLSRANAVRTSIIQYAKSNGIVMDETQFAVIGHGILKPKNGLCCSDPCPPKTEQEWRNNMRVEFRILQVEAESSVFKPL
ncbi:MAG: ABC transporter substrate-binding protein [Proteobacteria bacterium]|nr:ABC transporter substrate-binding protein [Pseudomonadota bacterium]MBU1640342.1 ABC transporter substrate-binding protein [Pseudomonadota bacterium]